MHHVALLVALSATSGLFSPSQPATTCSGGNCGASYGYYYPQQQQYYAPAPVYQPAAPAPVYQPAAPAPAAAPTQAQAPAYGPVAAVAATLPAQVRPAAPVQQPVPYTSYYYQPAPQYYPVMPGSCPGGTCYSR